MAFELIDPDEKLSFAIDFTTLLAGEDIAGTPVWNISPSGPTIGEQTETTKIATIFVNGVTLSVVYELSCKIATNGATPRTFEKSVTLRCEQR